jgi:hypothetical protein
MEFVGWNLSDGICRMGSAGRDPKTPNSEGYDYALAPKKLGDAVGE